MSNSILTSRIRVPFLAEVEANTPVLANGQTQYNKNFVGGNGSTIDILLPSFGNTVGTGADVTGDISDITNASVPVVLTQYHKAASLTQVERSLELSNYEEQVAKPFGMKLASDIQKIAIDEIKKSAATVAVSTTGKYTDIGDAIANLESSYANGDIFGVMSPKVAKGVVDSGLNFFQAELKGSFVSGDLGTYLGTRFYKTQDMGTALVTGAYVATAVAVNQPTAYVAGATTLNLDATTLTGTFKKYQSFTVAGVNSVDMYGNDTGIPYSFILQADVTAGTNAIAASIQGVYAEGAGINVTALPADGAVVTFQQAASSTYQTVLVWEKQAFVTASGNIKPLTMVESKKTDGKIMGLIASVGSDAVKGIDIIRWDCLVGFKVIYKNRIARLDIKVA